MANSLGYAAPRPLFEADEASRLNVLQTQQTSHQTGKLTIEATRYCTLLLGLFGLPLVFVAYPVLKLWIGRSYATQSICFLQGLILGNVIRQVGHPHSLAVI